MQEIVPNIYIETTYAGVTLGVINASHGLILIDAPIRVDDVRTWRSTLLNLGGGVDRLLINLDAHMDRTLGVRTMDCTVVGHEKMVNIFADRPISFKAQPTETGAEWELHNGLGSIRWSSPEITFSHSLYIQWDGNSISLVHRPGPTPEAIWVEIPEQKVIFLGDAVLPNQPPFLSNADLPVWMNMLNGLLQQEYRDYFLVGGRSGLLHMDDVVRQLHYLDRIYQALEKLNAAGGTAEQTADLMEELAPAGGSKIEYSGLYRQRLLSGLYQYYQRHYQSDGDVAEP
jgi:glyoxylase-like metal-dependent hydrolase (beta-lactamase superfamily II)